MPATKRRLLRWTWSIARPIDPARKDLKPVRSIAVYLGTRQGKHGKCLMITGTKPLRWPIKEARGILARALGDALAREYAGLDP